MITPTELDYIDINAYNIEAITIDIDDQIKKNHGIHNYEYAELKTAYPQAVRNEIAERYKAIGWTYVFHRVIDGNTEFYFSTTDSLKYIIKAYG